MAVPLVSVAFYLLSVRRYICFRHQSHAVLLAPHRLSDTRKVKYTGSQNECHIEIIESASFVVVLYKYKILHRSEEAVEKGNQKNLRILD
jgi:hypothetical protein